MKIRVDLAEILCGISERANICQGASQLVRIADKDYRAPPEEELKVKPDPS